MVAAVASLFPMLSLSMVESNSHVEIPTRTIIKWKTKKGELFSVLHVSTDIFNEHRVSS